MNGTNMVPALHMKLGSSVLMVLLLGIVFLSASFSQVEALSREQLRQDYIAAAVQLCEVQTGRGQTNLNCEETRRFAEQNFDRGFDQGLVGQREIDNLREAAQRLAQLPPGSTGNSVIDSAVGLASALGNAARCFSQDFAFGKCIFIPLMGWLGSWFITLGGYTLQLSAYIFNVLVEHLVVKFGATIQALGLIDGIHKAWTIMRDLSNILIIGMFVFIAISIILGNESFGQKKLVAHVLVIAVLINFSILFSKIAIDASNFIAFQIYRSMGTTENVNISGKFFAIVGIQSAMDTSDITARYAASADTTNPGKFFSGDIAGIAGFLYGLVTGTMLLFAAGVLFYGSYLIAVRAVLLVFLMLTSALAFASFLVPKLSESGYGWKAWWQSLINASVFGPLLMILLYISLIILNGAAAAREGTFSQIIANPKTLSDGQNWTVLALFIFGIGMLYVSFRVANSFSQRIAGFPHSIPNLVNPLAPIVGTSRLMGLMGRSSVGRFANWRHGVLKEKISKRGRATFLQSAFQRTYGTLKANTFDPLKTKTGTKLIDQLQGPDIGSKWGDKGYAGTRKRQIDHAVHTAEENIESKSSAEKRAQKAEEKKIREKMLKGVTDLEATIAKGGDSMKEAAKAVRAQSDDGKVLGNEVRKAATQITSGKVERGASGEAKPSEAANIEAERQHTRSEEAKRMTTQESERISRAQEATREASIGEISAAFDEITEANAKRILDEELKRRQNELAAFEAGERTSAHKKQIDAAKTDAAHKQHEAVATFAKQIAAWAPGNFIGDRGVTKGIDSALDAEAEKAALKKSLAAWRELDKDNSSHSSAGEKKPEAKGRGH